jgi:hypothetical protein
MRKFNIGTLLIIEHCGNPRTFGEISPTRKEGEFSVTGPCVIIWSDASGGEVVASYAHNHNSGMTWVVTSDREGPVGMRFCEEY